MEFNEAFVNYAGEYSQIQIDFLNSIDFLPMLEQFDQIEDIRRELEDIYDYGHKRDKIPPELHGCALNLMDDYEFGRYLEERYPEYILREEMKVWYEIRKRRG